MALAGEQQTVDLASLVAGPLTEGGRRLGLVRGTSDTVRLGLVLGVGLWIVLMVLAEIDGVGGRLLSLAAVGDDVRLLVAIPLFFLCESLFDPQVRAFLAMIVHAGVVAEGDVPELAASVAAVRRWQGSWAAEGLCLLAALGLAVLAPHGHLGVSASGPDPLRLPGGGGLADQWYWWVCLTVLRFLIFRWLVRLVAWWWLLLKIARLELALLPTHSDGVAGLGYLVVVHYQFLPLILALSAINAGALAESMSAGLIGLRQTWPAIAALLALDAAVFVAPLHLFTPKLWRCKQAGLATYMVLASRYVTGFDRKWVHPTGDPGEPLLGTGDIQSLADLTNSVNVVRNMRLSPANRGLLTVLAGAALAPFLPLLLLAYPIEELVKRLLGVIVGG